MSFGEVLSLLLAVFLFCWFVLRPLLVVFGKYLGEKEFEPISVFKGVSIIVPCHNEEDLIEETVQSILDQEYPVEKEVILVENGSTDGTWEKLCKLEKGHREVKATTVKVGEGNLPISTAMNHGLSLAKYPVILRLDADTKLKDKKAVQKAIAPILENRAVATACNIRLSNLKASILTRLQSIEYFFSMEIDRRSQSLYNSVICCSGAMQAFKTDVLKKVGGYHLHPHISEDMEVTIKMHREGRVEMVPGAVAYTDAPKKGKELIKQRFNWMKFGVVCLFIHRRGVGNRKYGHKGILGLVGLPLKVIMTFQGIVGVMIKLGFVFFLVGFGRAEEALMVLLWSALIHVGLVWLMMAIVSPVSISKQGKEAFWLVPVFSLFYQPCLAFVRVYALCYAVLVLFPKRKKLLLEKEAA